MRTPVVACLLSVCLGAVVGVGGAVAQHAEPFLSNVVQLTDAAQFSRAGEAYFSPDSEWIIFQAVPRAEETGGQPRYAMFVAKLKRDGAGTPTGMHPPIRISPPRSANTCGWFHPTLPGVVLFGSTLVEPGQQVDAGYSREDSKYSWEFPNEMEVVTRTVREIVHDRVANPTLRAKLLSRPDLTRPVPMWTRDGYDAEGSWSPDGRLVLYTAVNPQSGDGDIHVYDIASDTSVPLVVADGYDGGPFFSADGKWICYRSDRNNDNLLQLFVAELAFDARGKPTGIQREVQLTANEHVNWAPFWHPSGKYLVYATSEVSHRNYEVFAIPVVPDATGDSEPKPVRVTHADGFDGLPVFNADGSLMMWTGQRGAPDSSGRRSSQLYVARVTGKVPGGLQMSHGNSAPACGEASGSGGVLQATDAPVANALSRVTPSARRFQEHVTVLASQWLSGRLPGTRGIEAAEEYIEHWFKRVGLSGAGRIAAGLTHFHEFEFKPHGADEAVVGRNVMGALLGRGALAERHIIIGAHHDHLGRGEFSSLEGPGEIHEGADDNASGVAAVLLLAERLSAHYAALPDDANMRTIVFVTFSAEEMGLNGSRAFAKSGLIDLTSCDLMLNFDMIGRITNGRVSLSGLSSGDELETLLDDVLNASSLDVVRPDGLSARSDHAAFYDAEVPVLFMTIDPFHNDYHTPRDEPWKLNTHGASLAVDLAEQIVLTVARKSAPLKFTAVANYDQGPSIGIGGLKVRFGIMPGNYNDAEPGIVVQRVSPNTSASNSGILTDDRLMKWNGTTINSVSQWMELMAPHKPGDVVTVTVRRNGQEVELPVTLEAAK